MGVRLALGASQKRLIGQLLTENVLLSFFVAKLQDNELRSMLQQLTGHPSKKEQVLHSRSMPHSGNAAFFLGAYRRSFFRSGYRTFCSLSRRPK
jgi:hypothetical protein